MSKNKSRGYNLQGEFRNDWKLGGAVYLDRSELKILGHPVMEKWEAPYMQALANIATSSGGRILEVGFGMGIASGFIQMNKIDEHVIIEANNSVYKKLLEFKTSAPHKVIAYEGMWEDIINELEDQTFDGILYDTYPLSRQDLHTHQFKFLRESYRLLKKGGVVTYCNLTSWGNLRGEYSNEDSFFEQSQIKHIKEAGFSDIQYDVMAITPPDSCEYYKYNSIVVPKIYKN